MSGAVADAAVDEAGPIAAYAALWKRHAKAKALVKELKQDLDGAAETALDHMQEEDIQSVDLVGVKVYTQVSVYAGLKGEGQAGHDAFADVAMDTEFDAFMATKVNVQGLRSHFKEKLDDARDAALEAHTLGLSESEVDHPGVKYLGKDTDAIIEMLIPAALADVVNVSHKHEIRARKSAAKQ